jgi:hypothetical protein
MLSICQLSSPPSVTSPHVVRLYQSLAKPYISLAQAFERGDMKKLSAEIDTARNIWVKVGLHVFSCMSLYGSQS